MSHRRLAIIFFIVSFLFSDFGVASAAVMSSSTYKIQIDSINIGGMRGTSSNYALQTTLGESGTGRITGTSNYLYGGFQIPSAASAASSAAGPGLSQAGGGIPFLVISDIVVQSVTADTAIITFHTSKNASPVINFGQSESYDRTISGSADLTHTFVLEGLAPETLYHFEIVAQSDIGVRVRSDDRTLKTLPPSRPPEKAPPANVIYFLAKGRDAQIELSWENPRDADFKGVRIMRSAEFYPATPFDGEFIYQGDNEFFLDTDLENGRRYYYTAFAYDKERNFASGSAGSAIPQAPGLAPVIPPPSVGELPMIPPELIPASLRNLSFSDFDFIQKESKLPIIAGRIEVEQDFPLTIAIDYEKLPEVLKTILITMQNDKGEVFSFLLRVDEEKKRYLATLKPPVSGLYPITFTIVDYENRGLQKIGGELNVKGTAGGQMAPPPDNDFRQFLPELVIFLLVAFLMMALWIFARRYIGSTLISNDKFQIQKQLKIRN